MFLDIYLAFVFNKNENLSKLALSEYVHVHTRNWAQFFLNSMLFIAFNVPKRTWKQTVAMCHR